MSFLKHLCLHFCPIRYFSAKLTFLPSCFLGACLLFFWRLCLGHSFCSWLTAAFYNTGTTYAWQFCLDSYLRPSCLFVCQPWLLFFNIQMVLRCVDSVFMLNDVIYILLLIYHDTQGGQIWGATKAHKPNFTVQLDLFDFWIDLIFFQNKKL